jgi:hypothetical protein
MNNERNKMTTDQLLDALVLRAGQAQVVRMFKNSAQDGKSKLAQLEKEIADLKAIIMKQERLILLLLHVVDNHT